MVPPIPPPCTPTIAVASPPWRSVEATGVVSAMGTASGPAPLYLDRVTWPTVFREGRRYLDAVLGRHLHDPPPRVRSVFRDEWPRIIAIQRFAYLLEEPLIQAPGRLGYSILPTPSPTLLWACRVLLGT
jgi:hypothetical protein